MHMTQTNAEHVQNNALGYVGFPVGESLPPFADLSKVFFAAEPRGIRTREQLREFVERNVVEIHRQTLPVVRYSEERAREIVQELYPRLVTMLAAQPGGIREPWAAIRVITRNLAIDGHRKAEWNSDIIRRLREVKRPQRSESETDREEEMKTLATLVDEVLTTLEPRQARIITSIFLEGLLARDIGERLGLSQSRVSELKWDALERIRPHLLDRIARDCRDCFWSRGIVDSEGHRSVHN
jgi:RNA polymerase sigma factor (sigma-70 family)